MSLLLRVITSAKSRGTHHRLAVDALRHLSGEQADRWRNLFLVRHAEYLAGATAPDDRFKDYRNHVLHVEEGWGGAVAAAEQWYQQTVDSLRGRRWRQAAFAAGVLSHYLTDPIMPLHTAQSERENNIHRACEWSVARSYDQLLDRLNTELGGVPSVELPAQEQWLKRLVTRNAATAHADYERVVSDYEFALAVKNPVLGFSPELQERFARLLGLAIASYAKVLSRAIEESAARAPLSFPGIRGAMAAVAAPFDWFGGRLARAAERKQVIAIHRELKQTGRVEKTLPEENRTIRDLHAKEVLGAVLSAKAASPHSPMGAVASSAGVPASPSPQPAVIPVSSARPARQAPPGKLPRFHLEPDDSIVDAPSIGQKMAKRLQQVGIPCVEVFLEHSPADVVSLLEVNTISLEDVRSWQQQARLMCQAPGLRETDVQMLVGCGITDPDQLASADAAALLQQLNRYAASPTARRTMRNPQPPEVSAVRNWIAWAAYARPLRAA